MYFPFSCLYLADFLLYVVECTPEYLKQANEGFDLFQILSLRVYSLYLEDNAYGLRTLSSNKLSNVYPFGKVGDCDPRASF